MNYAEKLRYVQTKIQKYIATILKVYGNELLLCLEDYNLLQNPHNCIESSTAPGFILEEFILSKLEIFTQNHNGKNEIIVKRNAKPTIASSFDCYVNFGDIKILINHKAEKEKSSNSAVAAINKLYADYAQSEPNKEKGFLILKLKYRHIVSQKDKQRKIFISDIYSFYLEEIDFSKGHKQDHRNWSEEFKPSSGRLIIDNKFREEHIIRDAEMSYEKTKRFIAQIQRQTSAERI